MGTVDKLYAAAEEAGVEVLDAQNQPTLLGEPDEEEEAAPAAAPGKGPAKAKGGEVGVVLAKAIELGELIVEDPARSLVNLFAWVTRDSEPKARSMAAMRAFDLPKDAPPAPVRS